jgi:hypothetical protein
MKHSNLYFGLVLPSGGGQSLIESEILNFKRFYLASILKYFLSSFGEFGGEKIKIVFSGF